jgi:hypothetical protein
VINTNLVFETIHVENPSIFPLDIDDLEPVKYSILLLVIFEMKFSVDLIFTNKGKDQTRRWTIPHFDRLCWKCKKV